MVRFVHTADWQLGMTRHFLGDDAQARFSAARLDVIERIGRLAVEEACEFAVVCGDVFESNQVQRQVLVRALEKMAATPQVTFFLLPGNHDPLDASSIFRSSIFAEHRPDNVRVLQTSDPVQAVPGVELVAAPWLNKHPVSDLVGDACEGLAATSAIRIVVGHGAVDSMSPDPDDPRLIALGPLEDSIRSGLVHYVALGDRHSTTDVGATGRVWYAGAPEPTDYDEVDPGNVLVVDVDIDRKEGIEVAPRRLGTWNFVRREWELSADADINELEGWLEQINDKGRTIVKLSIVGEVSVAQKARLNSVLDHSADLLAALETWERRSDLAVIPDDADLDHFGLAGFAHEALLDLSEQAEDSSDGQRAADARDALALLYRLVGSGS